MVIDKELLDKVSEQAKALPRLRMNYNFHQSLDEKCHRFLNAVEPGTEVPIHKHPTKDETFVILRGKVVLLPIMTMDLSSMMLCYVRRKDDMV